MKTKSNKIRDHLAAGETLKAISVASKFFDRSDDTQLFKQAQSAAQNPHFYRQIGKDPDAIIAAAIDRLTARLQ